MDECREAGASEIGCAHKNQAERGWRHYGLAFREVATRYGLAFGGLLAWRAALVNLRIIISRLVRDR